MACSVLPNVLSKSHVLHFLQRPICHQCRRMSGRITTCITNISKDHSPLNLERTVCQTYSYMKNIKRQLHQSGQGSDGEEFHYKDLDARFKDCEETQKMFEELKSAFQSSSVDKVLDNSLENPQGDTSTQTEGKDEKNMFEDSSPSVVSLGIEQNYEGNLSDGEVEDKTAEWMPPIPLRRGDTGVFDIADLVKLLEDENAVDICVIKIPKILNYVDYMVIVTSISLRHMRAVAEDVRWIYKRRANRRDPSLKIEGADSKEWIALDLGNIALHIFERETRENYDLETLWTVGAAFDEKSQQKFNDPYVISASAMFQSRQSSTDQASNS